MKANAEKLLELILLLNLDDAVVLAAADLLKIVGAA